jgi:hypothetical protein
MVAVNCKYGKKGLSRMTQMPKDYEAVEVIGSLINELKNAIGERALKLPSVRKAMELIARNAWEDSETFRKEAEAREHQELLPKKH